MLHTAALLTERTGTGTWCKDCFRPLELVVEYLMELLAEDKKEDGLIRGVPEADEQKDPGKYFHNNGWIVKGLHRWVKICELCNFSPSIPIEVIQHNAEQLKKKTLSAIRQRWPKEPEDWWLPPRLEPSPRPACLTDTRLSSYTNYRYWPELLSSGLLPADMANRITEARLSAGGQFCGMTRFADWLDDWPLADYLYALWKLGRKEDFLLSLYGHISYHQAEVHLTAYEQVTFPPGEEKAPYCLPCQIVAARAARLINRK
ncbi:MAG: hypothetical protein AVO38_16345 [delta proteobacterium ML8_D]|nr:MAG: hypothetical protein AVO38_16345 [delta proteobacterium ML8_D]